MDSDSESETNASMSPNVRNTNYSSSKHGRKYYPLNVHIELTLCIATRNFRARCSIIREYPLYRLDIQSDLAQMFSKDSACHVSSYHIPLLPLAVC